VTQADGVEFGRPPQWLKWTLGRSGPVPLAAVFERKDYAGLKPEESMVFGNTCWALAHWLVVDQTLAGNRAVGQFLKYVAEGADGPAALRHSGLDLARVDAVVQAYLRQGEFRAVSLPLPAQSGAAWPARTISSAEWQAVSALFAVELGRGPAAAAAEARAREALRLEPGLVLANEALARALWVQAKLGEARGPLEAAVGASPDRLAARYLAGYLERDLSEKPEATGQEVGRGLEHARRAVALGVEFAPAHSLLADLLLRKGESPAEALALARRAVWLEPALPTHRLVFAKALARSGDAVRARGECETALAQAPEDGLRRQIEDLRATLPAVPTPTGGAP
jgi:tetratricopeptide (TPR) repeat protein